jgi:hypothetical protein
MNYSFDFLVFDNVDFLNYFANEHIRWVVFKRFKNSQSLLYRTLGFRLVHALYLIKALMPVF